MTATSSPPVRRNSGVAPRSLASRLWRRLLRSPQLRCAVCWAIHYYIRLVYRTNRWTVVNGEGPRRLLAAGRPFIGAFWHGRMMMIPMGWGRMAPMHMLISAHRDGRIIADAVAYFGIETIAGSTRHGGSAALRVMLKRLKDGDCVAITPDGPRGPAMSASIGIVNVARLARVPIVPITFATSRRRIAVTWDQFYVALPFGRGIFLWGEPIEIAADLDEAGLEDARRLVETRMGEMVREADGRMGHALWPNGAIATQGPGNTAGAVLVSTSPLATPRLQSAGPPDPPDPPDQVRGRGRGGAGRGYRPVILLLLCRALTWPLPPLVMPYLRRRRRRGKEDGMRLAERRGLAGAARPPGPLVWIHAASVGEAIAVLRLIERLTELRPKLEVLLTTGTVASAQLLEKRLPPRARHQFVPVDLPPWTRRFLDHWRPDLALWVESELWPNLVLTTRARGIPMMLINGRLSTNSYRRWRCCPALIRPLLGAFAQCLAQDSEQAERLRRLGGRNVTALGDLKAAGSPLPADPALVQHLCREIGGRPRWLAASTHQGEEEIAAAAHTRLAGDHPGILTLIAPRHPARGKGVAAMLGALGLKVARRSQEEPITAETDIYLADTIGELGLFYRLAGIAFVGGSLMPKGGHNPLEAARLGCAVLHGPDMSNCAAMAASLAAAGATETVRNAEELARAVALLLSDPQLRNARVAAGQRTAAAGEGVLDEVLARLAPWLDQIAPAPDGSAQGAAIEFDNRAPRAVRA